MLLSEAGCVLPAQVLCSTYLPVLLSLLAWKRKRRDRKEVRRGGKGVLSWNSGGWEEQRATHHQ